MDVLSPPSLVMEDKDKQEKQGSKLKNQHEHPDAERSTLVVRGSARLKCRGWEEGLKDRSEKLLPVSCIHN